jgi:AAA domain
MNLAEKVAEATISCDQGVAYLATFLAQRKVAEGMRAENKSTPAPRYLFETVSDLRSMPPQTWLVDRWVPDRSVGIVYGRFANGKSFIILDLILHLVYGMKEWHGIKLPGVPCHCLLIAREGSTGFQRRIDAFKKHHEIVEDTDRIVFMRSPVNFGDPTQFAELKAAIESSGRNFKAVVVDTVGRALPGEDMFDPKSITRFMEHLQQLGEISQGVAIGVHHENKAGGVMGSIYFDNSSDFMLHVEREGETGPLSRGKITCVKQKDGEDGWAQDVSYKFVETEPNGEGSLVVDSVTGSVKAEKPERLSDKHLNMLDALRDAIKEHGRAGKVHMDKWRAAAYAKGFLDDDATKRSKQFADYRSQLIAKGRIRVVNEMVEMHSSAARSLTGDGHGQ